MKVTSEIFRRRAPTTGRRKSEDRLEAPMRIPISTSPEAILDK